MPGTDLGLLFASIRLGSAPGAWHRFGEACLLASGLAPHRVPGTDLGCDRTVCHPRSPRRSQRGVLGADGTVETIIGTTIHPVWSVDRQEWVPIAKLADGERLCCDTESFGLGFPSSLTPKASGLVLSVSLSRVSQPVYNAEVQGEHVYQVGELGLLVHNACAVFNSEMTKALQWLQ